ncbi:hypothetical protein DHEL01_v200646 [Diaporthe helianthi]|uniref:Uncharacterized protein n=1 Tax=Diaporthe helianthi TaxID=158607 RepID=A0A2P5IEQ0_DIAHE|nr:hypothetical protein DHEL01_v200646 [Diaporthe helianthi]
MASKEARTPLALRRTYTTALTHWPKDPLRPTCQLQDVLSKRLAESNKFPGPDDSSSSSKNPAAQVNALVSLLGNRYLHKYPTSPAPESATGGMLKPRSNPTYYEDLMRDLDAAPTRSWGQRVGLKLKGMFRWQ